MWRGWEREQIARMREREMAMRNRCCLLSRNIHLKLNSLIHETVTVSYSAFSEQRSLKGAFFIRKSVGLGFHSASHHNRINISVIRFNKSMNECGVIITANPDYYYTLSCSLSTSMCVCGQ
jgi:hypothetical protein